MSLYSGLMDLVYDITTTALGLGSNAQNVVPLYDPESVGVLKDPKRNYVFYLVQFTDDAINKQIDVVSEANPNNTLVTKKIKYVRNLRFAWQFYGDDGFEWADSLRMRLFDSDIKTLLANSGISIVTSVNEPVFIPEPIGNQWYKRYDLTAKFNQLVIRETTESAIANATVYIETDEGVVAECSV
jgi:hypothetical protein